MQLADFSLLRYYPHTIKYRQDAGGLQLDNCTTLNVISIGTPHRSPPGNTLHNKIRRCKFLNATKFLKHSPALPLNEFDSRQFPYSFMRAEAREHNSTIIE